MATIKYYSAEYVGPTHSRGARLRIKNRDNGKRQDFAWDNEGNSEWHNVQLVHTSPLLKVEKLWYDEALSMLFFRTIEG